MQLSPVQLLVNETSLLTIMSLNMKSTKAELLAEVERLKNIKETPDPISLILKGFNLLFKQIKYEVPLLIKDVRNAGSATKQAVTAALDSKNF